MNSTGFHILLRPLVGLAGNLLVSRVISGAALIAFAALAGPEPFAPFGMYLAVVTVMWVVVCGRYEQAIVFAASDSEAATLSWLSASIGLAVVTIGLMTAALWLLLDYPLPSVLAASPILVLAAPLSLATRAVHRILLKLATREGNFTAYARAVRVQAVIQAVLQLGLYWLGITPVLCLVIADAAGTLAAAAVIVRASQAARKAVIARPSSDEFTAVAARWRMMPAWNMPTSLLSVAALSAPALLVPLVYSTSIAGQLVLGLRLMELPTSVFTSAATPILQRHLAASGDKTSFIWRTIILLATIGLAAYGSITLAALATENLFAATRWEVTAAAIPWLAPYFAGLAVSGPLVELVAGLRSERQFVWCHLIFLALTLAAAILALTGASWPVVLAAFGTAMLLRAAMFSVLLVNRATAAKVDPSVS